MYTLKQRQKAVQLFIESNHNDSYVVSKLGYPSPNALRIWFREYQKTGSLHKKYIKKPRFDDKFKHKAISFYLNHDYTLTQCCRILGGPCRATLSKWIKENGGKNKIGAGNDCKSKKTTVHYNRPQKFAIVSEHLIKGIPIYKVAAKYRVSKAIVSKWKRELLCKDPPIMKKKIESGNKQIKGKKIESGNKQIKGKKIESGNKLTKRKNIDVSKEKLESEIVDLQLQIQNLKAEIDTFKTESNVFKAERDTFKTERDTFKTERDALQMERDALEVATQILKKTQGINLKTLKNNEKAEVIGALRNKYQLNKLLALFNMSKSSYFYCCATFKKPDKYLGLRTLIKKIFQENYRCYGYRRVYLGLKRMDIVYSEKVVRRIMREEHLTVFTSRRKKYNSYMGEISPAVRNLIQRDFHAEKKNTKWLTDITEFALPAGKVYLSPIVDCYEGSVVNWTIGTSPNAMLVNSMLQGAIQTLNSDEHPIIHTDRGAHYRWPEWIELIENAGLTRSMSRKGCTPDNSACEGFFGRLKNEFFYCRTWEKISLKQFMKSLDCYIHWYNEKRIKLSLNGLSPEEYRYQKI